MFNKLLLVSLLVVGQLCAIPAVPTPVTLTQPDGSTIQAFHRGDERAAWFETEAGYSIVRDQTDTWVFAVGVNGQNLIPGSEPASNNMLSPTSRSAVEKHLKPEVKLNIRNYEKLDLQSVVGDTFHIPLILIQFPDHQAIYSDSALNDVMNLEGYGHLDNIGSGSFIDFYHEISYGQFNPVHHVMYWIDAPQNHDYYAYDEPEGYSRVLELVRAAVDTMEAHGVDWSIYDNNNDGTLDALNLIHAGPGAEEGDHSNIWSHKWYLSAGGHQVTYDGVQIDGYSMNPEIQNDNIVAIGVLAHEFGHALGLPDLYDTDYTSSGSGRLALMASGSWGTSYNTPWYPSAMNAWSKAELGWVNTVLLSDDQAGVAVEQSFSNNTIYRVDHPEDDSEYWLIENRAKVGTDQKMPSPGLLLWHIDTEKTSGWSVNNDEPHYGVGLEQADGLFELENNGSSDGGDPYPGLTDNREFSNQTTPSSVSYYYFPSMISIENISDPDSVMTFDLTFQEILLAEMTLDSGAGFAHDFGTTTVSLNNTVPVTELYFELVGSPGILSITDVQLQNGATADSIILDGNYIELVNPQIPVNVGAFLNINLFARTGIDQDVSLTMDNYYAADSSGNEIALVPGNATYQVYGRPQAFTIVSDSASIGGSFQYQLNLGTSVPLKMIAITISDDSGYLIISDEIFTDANGNNQWDEGEEFTDWNQDGTWTPAIQISDRVASWSTTSNITSQGLVFQSASWVDSMAVSSGMLFKVNGIIDNLASSGDVNFTSSNILLMDMYGNMGVPYEGGTGTLTITDAVGTQITDIIPQRYVLSDNYPNPFNPTTSLDYQVPENGLVGFTIYDIRGAVVSHYKREHSPGTYQLQWNGLNMKGHPLASGTYFLHMEAPGFTATKKLLLLK